jgi:hypothetical protein
VMPLVQKLLCCVYPCRFQRVVEAATRTERARVGSEVAGMIWSSGAEGGEVVRSGCAAL